MLIADPMLRFVAVILLSACVCAMPSYAAIMCGSACALSSMSSREQGCCPTTSRDHRDHSSQSDSKQQDQPDKHHCAAPCCGYVAHVFSSDLQRTESEPLFHMLPTASALHDSLTHEAIFH